MRTTNETFEKFRDVDFSEILDTMGAYNDQLITAGVLRAAEGLDDPANGVVVDFTTGSPVVVGGPYGDTEKLFNGYYILEVESLDDAVAWAIKMPLMEGSKVEIRRVPSIDEFPQDSKWVRSEREWRENTGQL
ncbi:MAG: YciI family protein [Glaciihabitans sp.]